MEDQQFDNFTKSLITGLSRRSMLKRLIGGTVGAALASFGLAGFTNAGSTAAQRCSHRRLWEACGPGCICHGTDDGKYVCVQAPSDDACTGFQPCDTSTDPFSCPPGYVCAVSSPCLGGPEEVCLPLCSAGRPT